MEQLRLFPEDVHHLTVTVFDYGNYYQAEIAGGWWIARGKSAKEAVKKIKRMYEKARGL